MSLKKNEILLTNFDIKILEYLIDDKNKPFKKWDLYLNFKDKGNNRIKDRLDNLQNLQIIDEKKEKNYKILKILNPPVTNSILKFFENSTR